MNQMIDSVQPNLDQTYIPATTLFVYPSVFKEMSRIVDMWGFLDVYSYSKSSEVADCKALRRDSMIAMKGIADAEKEYVGKKSAKIS
jgi:hypothetical protein